VTAPGPNAAPPRQSAGAGPAGSRARQILLSLVPIVSVGFLSFVPFLYIALVRRRRQDWLVCASYVGAVIATVILISIGPSGSAAATVGGGLILLLMGLGATHSLVALRPGAGVGSPTQAILAQPGLAQPGLAQPGLAQPGLAQPDQRAVLNAAKARIHQRAEARKLAGDNPVLARDLKIGRPDLQRSYDDGGLVDVNHVGADVMVRYLDLSPAEAEAIVAARGQLGRFASCSEVSTYANLRPDRLDAISDLIIFD
jgi:DNA uptake protein ComE-like DNA-binding protein